MSEAAVWTVGVLLGAAAMTGTGLLLARWWFGADLFKKQYPAHRAGDEPEPRFPEPSTRIPANLFATPAEAAAYWASDDARPGGLGPPPTYPETPEESTR